MANDRTRHAGPERRQVAAMQGYDHAYFGRTDSISRKQATTFITSVGHDRDRLDVPAPNLKGT
ncbi:hypothetical protein ACFB49_26690 [Sphingomonas sp. DBB INV C78]|uniref:DUF3606 domain-containing protein n=1 Tax=Sphingomonas sp. DBB INV C78 TaxID=3349434 RepID=UPI0036D38F1B